MGGIYLSRERKRLPLMAGHFFTDLWSSILIVLWAELGCEQAGIIEATVAPVGSR